MQLPRSLTRDETGWSGVKRIPLLRFVAAFALIRKRHCALLEKMNLDDQEADG